MSSMSEKAPSSSQVAGTPTGPRRPSTPPHTRLHHVPPAGSQQADMNRRPPQGDEEAGRATKVENLLAGQRSFAVSPANNTGDHPQQQSTASPGATAGSSHNPDHAQKPSPLSATFAATNGQSQPGSQQPSVPSSPFAARQTFDGQADNGPQRTFNGQFSSQQTQFRRQRQHAATISEPMPPHGVMMRTTAQQPRNFQQQPQQQQQPFPRFEQQPPGQQETRPYHQHRPRQLSLVHHGGPHDQPRDQYETSFSRSTSHAGAHFGSAQPSPQAPYFAPNSAYGPRGPPQQLGPPQHPAYGPPPQFQSRASFSHVGPRMHSQRSLSPPLSSRGPMPPGRFDPNAPQRSPLPFP
ncbi:hypothetical protein FBU59_005912, partial [Linderina macrospora]